MRENGGKSEEKAGVAVERRDAAVLPVTFPLAVALALPGAAAVEPIDDGAMSKQ